MKSLFFTIGPPTVPPNRLLSNAGFPGMVPPSIALLRQVVERIVVPVLVVPLSRSMPLICALSSSPMLNCPPAECPYSALNWFVDQVEFRYRIRYHRGVVPRNVQVVVIHTIHRKRIVSRPVFRRPIRRFPAFLPASQSRSATSTARLIGLPFSVPGAFGKSTSLLSNVLFKVEVVVCTVTAPLDTSTTSVPTPSSSFAFASLSWFATTFTSVFAKFLNPFASISTLYRPGNRLGTL